MIVADASVLIAHLDGSDAHHAGARDLLRDAAGEPLGAGPVTVAEVLVGPARAGRLDEARGALATLGLVEVPLGPDAPARLAALRAATGLKLPDCCVLLAAQDASATALLTFDARLRAAAVELGLAR